MSDTTFVDRETVVEADWLQDVNDLVYRYIANVRLYGAVGDGVTNDTAAIQAAIDASGMTTADFIRKAVWDAAKPKGPRPPA